jgi:hypothetical protein
MKQLGKYHLFCKHSNCCQHSVATYAWSNARCLPRAYRAAVKAQPPAAPRQTVSATCPWTHCTPCRQTGQARKHLVGVAIFHSKSLIWIRSSYPSLNEMISAPGKPCSKEFLTPCRQRKTQQREPESRNPSWCLQNQTVLTQMWSLSDAHPVRCSPYIVLAYSPE